MKKLLNAFLVGGCVVFFLYAMVHQSYPLPRGKEASSQAGLKKGHVKTTSRFTLLGINIPAITPDEENIQGANLQHQEMRGFDEPGNEEGQGANLEKADLCKANLQGIYLLWANLRQANLQEADLEGTYLSWANLANALLNGANLQGANLQGANLERADLQEANLKNANLQGANLLWTNLHLANLMGTNLMGTYLSWVNVSGAKYSQNTKFPKEFSPSEHGMVLMTE